jgi:deoxyribodipyrimidine photolyase-related protein
VTREVLDLVNREFPDAPGRMETFRWPATEVQARRALERFIDRRLVRFGTYEDAMWEGEPFLYHSALSSSLNLKLLGPMQCVEAAVAAYDSGKVAINNVEGFVRQIIGWREFIRGVYYREGEDYPARNTLDQHGDLPWFFWTGETEMNCLRHCLGDVVNHAYSHHITRLMVIGNFALIAGVHPAHVHAWFLAMYVDAVEWVTAPNVVGMSQHADGGVVGTKPYAASGKYIDRMSNFCRSCPYDVKRRAGKNACPFNVFYWDFLMGNEKRLRGNRRMSLVLRSLERLDEEERRKIRSAARRYRKEFKVGDSR